MTTCINEQSFKTRAEKGNAWAFIVAKFLERKEFVKSLILTKGGSIDDLAGIDGFENDSIPVQLKGRYTKNRLDAPVCLMQPNYGIENYKEYYPGIENFVTTDGRDFRGLKNKVTEKYYVYIMKDDVVSYIYMMPCVVLRPLVMEFKDMWWNSEKNFSYIPPQNCTAILNDLWISKGYKKKRLYAVDDGREIWWQKNYHRDHCEASKINMYIPDRHKTWFYELTSSDLVWAKDMIKKIEIGEINV